MLEAAALFLLTLRERFGIHRLQRGDPPVLDGRIVDGGILQAVAEGFVVEQDARTGSDCWSGGEIPVVDVFVVGCWRHFVASAFVVLSILR